MHMGVNTVLFTAPYMYLYDLHIRKSIFFVKKYRFLPVFAPVQVNFAPFQV